MAGYSLDGSPDNCYPDTTVLVNKFGIRDQAERDTVEKQITLLRAVQAEQETRFEQVDFAFYKNLHRLVFSDLYEWAGTVRTINIFKKGTVFCSASEISALERSNSSA